MQNLVLTEKLLKASVRSMIWAAVSHYFTNINTPVHHSRGQLISKISALWSIGALNRYYPTAPFKRCNAVSSRQQSGTAKLTTARNGQKRSIFMGQMIIERVISQSKGLIKDSDTFKRTLRGADGTGYDYISDEQLEVLYLFYVMEVSDNG